MAGMDELRRRLMSEPSAVPAGFESRTFAGKEDPRRMTEPPRGHARYQATSAGLICRDCGCPVVTGWWAQHDAFHDGLAVYDATVQDILRFCSELVGGTDGEGDGAPEPDGVPQVDEVVEEG